MNTKIAILLFFTSIIYNPVFGCWEGCIVDRCTGEPLPNYPMTYMQPGEKGLRSTPIELTTGEDGCFRVEGEEGSRLLIGESSFYYQSGPCQELGDVSMFNAGGHLQLASGNQVVDISQFPNGPSSSLPNVYGYGCDENYIQLSYSFGISACARYKIFNENNELVHEFDGSFRHDAGNTNLFGNLVESGIYRLEYTLYCCDNEGVVDESYSETFVGTFNYQANSLNPGDVKFDWIGSFGTEQINQDGNLYDNTHPSDGNDLMQLGELTCGAYLSQSQITSNVKRVRHRLERLFACDPDADGEILYDADQEVGLSGGVLLTVNFNSLTNGYFLDGTDYTKGETCFRYTTFVYYDLSFIDENCESLGYSSVFQIADNCQYCMTINEITPELVEALNLTSDKISQIDLIKKDDSKLVVSPNPVKDILYFSNSEFVENITILSSAAKVMCTGKKTNQINILDFPAGLYFVKCTYKNGTTEVHKIVKE